jgi:hypothetical protein
MGWLLGMLAAVSPPHPPGGDGGAVVPLARISTHPALHIMTLLQLPGPRWVAHRQPTLTRLDTLRCVPLRVSRSLELSRVLAVLSVARPWRVHVAQIRPSSAAEPSPDIDCVSTSTPGPVTRAAAGGAGLLFASRARPAAATLRPGRDNGCAVCAGGFGKRTPTSSGWAGHSHARLTTPRRGALAPASSRRCGAWGAPR